MKKIFSNKYTLIVMSLVSVTILVLGVTYSFFGWSSTEEDKDSVVDVMILGGGGSCDKISDNNKLLFPSATREGGRKINIKVNHTVGAWGMVSFELIVNRINAVGTTTNGLKHASFKYELVNTTTDMSYGGGSFSEINVGDTITFSSDETLRVNTNYNFTLYLWIDGEWGMNPVDMQNQSYDFDINCTITGANPYPNFATYISDIYDNASKTTVTNGSITYNYAKIYDTDEDDATKGGLMNDRLGGTTSDYNTGNIRYYGANPSNYVYFNCNDYNDQSDSTCEKWRIIGVFDDKVKIMRRSTITLSGYNYTQDEDNNYIYSNNWHTSFLKDVLNGQYYERKNDSDPFPIYLLCLDINKCPGGTLTSISSAGYLKDSQTRTKINEITWNLGGRASSSAYAHTFYRDERGTSKCASCTYDTTWTGKVALIYPSDYGYGADFTKCSYQLSNYSNSSCKDNNWLESNISLGLLTLTPSTSNNYNVFGNAGATGNLSAIDVRLSKDIFPVVYLKSNQLVKDGDGTADNPYQLGA